MTNTKSAVTILMADDDEEDRMLTADAFRQCRLANELRFVEDGEELLDYLFHRGDYTNPEDAPRPGLILLDLNMPKMDGRRALEEIKKCPSLRQIPVVVLTTSTANRDISQTYDLGVNSFIAKPVTFDGLVETVAMLGKYWFQIVELPELDEKGNKRGT